MNSGTSSVGDAMRERGWVGVGWIDERGGSGGRNCRRARHSQAQNVIV